jgi:hypothetical protein
MLVVSRLASPPCRSLSRGVFASAKALGASSPGFPAKVQCGAVAGGAKASPWPATGPGFRGFAKPAVICACVKLQPNCRSMTMSSGPTKPEAGFVTIIENGFQRDVPEQMMYDESGEGEMHTHDGQVYIGAWKNGKKTGKGILKTRSIANSPEIIYEGNFANDVLDGHATLRMMRKDPKGDAEEPVFVYDGLWMNGQRHGPSIVKTKEYVLKVEYKKGHRASKGQVEYRNGDRYDGGIFGGYPRPLLHHGLGKMTHASCDEADWEGMWCKGKRVEEGDVDDSSFPATTSDSPQAQHLDEEKTIAKAETTRDIIYADEIHRRGTVKYADGRVYEGEYKARTDPHGRGVMRYPDGSVYDGEWKDGKRYGE